VTTVSGTVEVTDKINVILIQVFRTTCRWHVYTAQGFCTPPLFHPNFGGLPVGPDRRYVGVSPSIYLKLFGREIIFEVFQPIWLRYLNVTDDMWHHRRSQEFVLRGRDNRGAEIERRGGRECGGVSPAPAN